MQDLHSAKKILSDGQPLVISIRLGTGFHDLSDIKYNGQNIIWKKFGSRKGNHAMVCVGYDDDLEAIKVLNSWGPSWAMNGYCYIDYSIVESSLNYFCFPSKTVKNYKPTEREDQEAQREIPEESGVTNSTLTSLTTWFKEGYYRPFANLKIVLGELNRKKNYAVIEVRNNDYELLKTFFIKKGTRTNFYIGNEKFSFSLNDIGNAGRNIFKKAAFFTISNGDD
jgi:hypothetical protein